MGLEKRLQIFQICIYGGKHRIGYRALGHWSHRLETHALGRLNLWVGRKARYVFVQNGFPLVISQYFPDCSID